MGVSYGLVDTSWLRDPSIATFQLLKRIFEAILQIEKMPEAEVLNRLATGIVTVDIEKGWPEWTIFGKRIKASVTLCYRGHWKYLCGSYGRFDFFCLKKKMDDFFIATAFAFAFGVSFLCTFSLLTVLDVQAPPTLPWVVTFLQVGGFVISGLSLFMLLTLQALGNSIEGA